MPELNAVRERRREIRLRKTRALLDQPLDLAVNYSIAQERAILEEAFRLVYDAYVEVGLQAPNETGIRFTKYHVIPTTRVFVGVFRPELAKQDLDRSRVNESKRVVGTLTLVMDSSLGLPLEKVCGTEIRAMREAGARLAEVIAFAIAPEFRRHNVMMYLYKVMFQYARLKGLTDICCAATKRHIEFYRDILLFRPLGELQPYEAGNNLEVQGHVLNVERGFGDSKATYSTDDLDANLHDFFFAAEVDQYVNEGKPWDEALIRYFLEERTRFFAQLSYRERTELRYEYQRCGLGFPY